MAAGQAEAQRTEQEQVRPHRQRDAQNSLKDGEGGGKKQRGGSETPRTQNQRGQAEKEQSRRGQSGRILRNGKEIVDIGVSRLTERKEPIAQEQGALACGRQEKEKENR